MSDEPKNEPEGSYGFSNIADVVRVPDHMTITGNQVHVCRPEERAIRAAERKFWAIEARREAASWETAASISGADHAKTGAAAALRAFAERIEKGE